MGKRVVAYDMCAMLRGDVEKVDPQKRRYGHGRLDGCVGMWSVRLPAHASGDKVVIDEQTKSRNRSIHNLQRINLMKLGLRGR